MGEGDSIEGFVAGAQAARSLSLSTGVELQPYVVSLRVWLSSVVGWLLHNWIVLVVGGVTGLIVGTPFAVANQQYSAEALIAPSRLRTQAQFEPSITSVTNGDALALAPERRQALADLVSTGAVEMDAIRRLTDSAGQTSYRPGELASRIHGALKPRSELISIQAEASTPAEATAIANAWAESYVAFINRLYVTGSQSSQVALRTERDKALVERDASQSAFEANLQQSQVEALAGAIARRQVELSLLPATSTGTPTSANDYRLLQVRTLNDLAQTLRRIDVAEQSAQVIKAGMTAAAGGASSDEAALSVLKAQLVSISGGPNSNLQLTVATDSLSDPAQLDALLANLRQARQQTSQTFESQRVQYELQASARAAQLDDELRGLRADLERAQALRSSLQAQRDLALTTYTALAKKVEEQRLVDADSGREVELGSLAGHAAPVALSTLVPRAIAVAVGVLAAALLVIALRGLRRVWRESPRFGPASGLS